MLKFGYNQVEVNFLERYSILVVEDEKNISDVIVAYLKRENFSVFTSFDGEDAIELFNKEEIDLIILDLMLPKLSGEQVCKEIREKSNVPIIILTAKTEEEDKISGLSIGADDYVSKPFSPKELTSRVNAVLRRAYSYDKVKADVISFNKHDLEIEKSSMRVNKSGNEVNLTSNEFKILLVLASNPNQVLSREQLIESVFGYDYDGFDRTIDTHIKNIRHKIEDNPKSPTYIQTVYGSGYRFNSLD